MIPCNGYRSNLMIGRTDLNDYRSNLMIGRTDLNDYRSNLMIGRTDLNDYRSKFVRRFAPSGGSTQFHRHWHRCIYNLCCRADISALFNCGSYKLIDFDGRCSTATIVCCPLGLCCCIARWRRRVVAHGNSIPLTGLWAVDSCLVVLSLNTRWLVLRLVDLCRLNDQVRELHQSWL